MSEREERFEEMLNAVRRDYENVTAKMEKLRSEEKTKTATYRQLLGDKLMLQNILTRYKIYGLLDEKGERR